MKKYIYESVGMITGFFTPWIKKIAENEIFTDWIQPLILSALCAFVGFLVTHACRLWVERMDKRRAVIISQNGRKK